jgi:hypothetical protein
MAWSSESAGSGLRNERSTFARCARSSERRAFSAFAISSCSFMSRCIQLHRRERSRPTIQRLPNHRVMTASTDALIARSRSKRQRHDPPRLLRARRERPRGCSAAQQCDELAPSHTLPLVSHDQFFSPETSRDPVSARSWGQTSSSLSGRSARQARSAVSNRPATSRPRSTSCGSPPYRAPVHRARD